MRRSIAFTGVGLVAAGIIVLSGSEAEAGTLLIDYVQRQPSTPGVAETGHLNISGTARAGSFVGSGSLLTGLNASALTSGTLPDARLSANVARVNNNNLFASTQRFASHVQFVGQNNGIQFATPTLNSTSPMITMGGASNSSYARTVLAHSLANPNVGLRFSGFTNAFTFKGNVDALTVDLDGFVGINGVISPSNGLYVHGRDTLNSAARFHSAGATWALTTLGDAALEGDVVVADRLAIGRTQIGSIDLAINDSDTGFNGSAGAIDAIINGTVKARFRTAGLGIGKEPTVPLDVVGTAYVRNSSSSTRLKFATNAHDVGELTTFDPNGLIKAFIASYKSGNNYGSVLAACDGNGMSQAWVDCKADSGLGTLVADVKNFRAINPRDLSTDIYYASLEGPEAAMYIRGKSRLVNGRATIELPLHFKDLANAETLTIQLTPASFRSKGLGYEVDAQGNITVGELADGQGNYEFSWVVTAVRKGFEDYEVIRPWTEAPLGSATKEQAWAARQQKMEKQREKRP